MYYVENHYSSEMHFLPNPDGKAEDDGVLITIVFDGEKEQSYFLVMDAKSFEPINKAYLPHNIPWSAHGLWFPEAKQSIKPYKTYKDEPKKKKDAPNKKKDEPKKKKKDEPTKKKVEL